MPAIESPVSYLITSGGEKKKGRREAFPSSFPDETRGFCRGSQTQRRCESAHEKKRKGGYAKKASLLVPTRAMDTKTSRSPSSEKKKKGPGEDFESFNRREGGTKTTQTFLDKTFRGAALQGLSLVGIEGGKRGKGMGENSRRRPATSFLV